MKAITLSEAGTPPAVRDDVPVPTPGPGQVLVRVQASSANPADNSIAAGMLAEMGVQYEYPVTLGRDYAGVGEDVGPDVSDYAPGDEVFGFLLHANPTARDGSWTELITVSSDASIACRPTSLEAGAAGAAPLAAITALTAIDALDLSQGDTVLIVGATGGVGSFAVQLASRAGATVIAPALTEDERYLRDLGVTEVLPREGDVAAAVRARFPDGVDALLDLVNYTSGTYDAALKDGARIASPTGAAGEGPGRTMVMAPAHHRQPRPRRAAARQRRAQGPPPAHLPARARHRGAAGTRNQPHSRQARHPYRLARQHAGGRDADKHGAAARRRTARNAHLPSPSTAFASATSAVASLINLSVGLLLLRVGRRERSIVLEADGRHLMTDVLTSAGVIIGVAGVAVAGWDAWMRSSRSPWRSTSWPQAEAWYGAPSAV